VGIIHWVLHFTFNVPEEETLNIFPVAVSLWAVHFWHFHGSYQFTCMKRLLLNPQLRRINMN